MLSGWCTGQRWLACPSSRPLKGSVSPVPVGLAGVLARLAWRLLLSSGFCGCQRVFLAHFRVPKKSPEESPKSPGFLWILRHFGLSGLSQNSGPRPPQVASPDLHIDCLGLPKSPPRVSRLTSLPWPSPLPAPKIGCSALSQLLSCPTPVPHILPYVQRHTERHRGTLRGTEAH